MSGGSGIGSTPDIDALSAGLDVLALRERLLANNLANADTPGYQRLDVNFDRAFQAALDAERQPGGWARTAAMTVPGAGGITRGAGLAYGADGNGVDVDQEMAELAETGLHYQAASQMLALALGRLRTAITGRA